MLQQTQAARVAPAFEAFLRAFPTVRRLAAATTADVLRAWSGLGYHRRAVALHATARLLAREHGGRVPRDPAVLRSLPGVGPYTAAAVASIAYGVAVPAVDTNARRVVARAVAGAEPQELSPVRIEELASAWLDADDPGGWNAAVMDLGRTRCRPRAPRCDGCPLEGDCRFRAAGRNTTAEAAPATRQRRFEGSTRQVRGAVVAVLRDRPSATRSQLVTATGFAGDRVDAAVRTLARDGVVVEARGRVRLPA